MALNYRVIGAHMRNARKQKGISQREASKRLGLSPSYYGKFERGEIPPSLERLEQICEMLEIPIDEVFRGATTMPSKEDHLSEGDNEFASFFKSLSLHLSSEEKELIRDLVERILRYSKAL